MLFSLYTLAFLVMNVTVAMPTENSYICPIDLLPGRTGVLPSAAAPCCESLTQLPSERTSSVNNTILIGFWALRINIYYVVKHNSCQVNTDLFLIQIC